jgi:RNA polymerase sigma-70 factor (ECF subfamily)
VGDSLHSVSSFLVKPGGDVTEEMSDPAFAARVRGRDPAALRYVAKAYLAQILRTARAAGFSPERAEDVTQSTFETFIEAAPRFEGRSHVRTWLFGILYNKISEMRRQESRARSEEDIDEVMQERFTPGGSWARPPRAANLQVYDAHIRVHIEDCLEAVPIKQRMAFVLSAVQEFDTAEVCKILDVSVTHLGVLLYRARNRLRECLEGKGIRESGE